MWRNALEHVDLGWLDGPFPSDEDGKLVTGEGPQRANLASRFGLQPGKKLRVVDGLRRSPTDTAAAARTSVNPLTWDHFAALVRTFQAKGTSGNVATAKADSGYAYIQLPARDGRKMWVVVFPKDPPSGKMRGFIPETQLFGPTAAVLHYNTVLRVMETMAGRWLRIP